MTAVVRSSRLSCIDRATKGAELAEAGIEASRPSIQP